MNFYSDNKILKHYLRHPLMERIAAMKEDNFSQAEQYNFAPVDLEDAFEGYEEILHLAGEICAEVIAPNAPLVEEQEVKLVDGRVSYAPATQENIDVFTKAGLMGVTLPRCYGGLNMPMTILTLIEDMICRADAGFGNLWALQACAETINNFGSEEQKARILPRICAGETMSMDLTEPDAGSDLQRVQLKATYSEEDGCWYLDGVKRFITNGDSDVHLVLARSEEGSGDGRGLSLFICEKSCGGVKTRRIENKMGIHGSPTCEIVFTHARAELCGSRKMGLIKYVMALMNSARLGIATQSVGLSEAAYREALAYARSRRQFGKEIIELPAVYDLVNSIKARLDASRSLLYETARQVDLGAQYTAIAQQRPLTAEERTASKLLAKKADALTPLIKGMGSEFANLNTYDAVQVHGGSGYMKDYSCERLYRDARITSIYEGTTQLQVVASIRYATGGFYTQLFEEYLSVDVPATLQPLKERAAMLVDEYKKALEKVTALENQEALDFLSRRIYEITAYTIMSLLLIIDATANEELFAASAAKFVAYAEAAVAAHTTYIKNFTVEHLTNYTK